MPTHRYPLVLFPSSSFLTLFGFRPSSRPSANEVSSPPYGLPQELLDIIIEHCDGDAPSLRVCSLVGKAWRARSQTLLFRTVVPTSRPSVTKLIHVLDDAPHIASSVRRVVLRAPYLEREDVAVKDDDWLGYAYRELGQRLPGATHLHIEGWCRFYSSAIEKKLSTGFLALSHLSVLGTRLGSTRDLISSLRARPRLDHLRLSSVSTMEPMEAVIALSPAALRTFEIDFSGRNESINTIPLSLSLGDASSHLQAVRLGNLYKDQVPVALGLLRTVATSLQRLDIGFGFGDYQAAVLIASTLPCSVLLMLIKRLTSKYRKYAYIRDDVQPAHTDTIL
jgi:hypothetical protein